MKSQSHYPTRPFDSLTHVQANTWVVRDSHGLDRLAPIWNSLESACHSPMQHFIWSRACAETFGSVGALRVTAVGSDGRYTAIAPLVKRSGLVPSLESIGVRELYEPMDFLYADEHSLAALADSLAEQETPLCLGRLRADSPVIAAITAAYQRRGWIHTVPVDSYPYIELSVNWQEPDKQFNSGRRSDFRRAQRHASQIGETILEILSPTPSETSALLEEALQVEKASWKGEAGSALALDPVRGAFFRCYAVAASEQGILRLVFMRIGGQAVGMQIAIESNDRFWLLKIGHDEKYSKCSPGTQLMLHTLKYAATRGLRSYEFLGTAEPWTRTWSTLCRPCVALGAYPFRFTGLSASTRDALRFALMRVKQKIRGRA